MTSTRFFRCQIDEYRTCSPPRSATSKCGRRSCGWSMCSSVNSVKPCARQMSGPAVQLLASKKAGRSPERNPQGLHRSSSSGEPAASHQQTPLALRGLRCPLGPPLQPQRSARATPPSRWTSLLSIVAASNLIRANPGPTRTFVRSSVRAPLVDDRSRHRRLEPTNRNESLQNESH